LHRIVGARFSTSVEKSGVFLSIYVAFS